VAASTANHIVKSQRSIATSHQVLPWPALQLVFQDDCCEKDLELIHKLKLYADNEQTPQSTKKPVRVP